MSLFEQPDYEWRETYFVLFDHQKLPDPDSFQEQLTTLGRKFEVSPARCREDGSLESLTVYAHADFAAMDITCVAGEEVVTQLPELLDELRPNCESDDEHTKLERIAQCTGRIDIYHFEKKGGAAGDGEDEMEFMDPGGVLMVLDKIAEICDGIIVDPQTSSLMI